MTQPDGHPHSGDCAGITSKRDTNGGGHLAGSLLHVSPDRSALPGLPGDTVCGTCTRSLIRPIRFGLTLEEGIRLQVLVRDNNVDQALKALKKKMQREGIFREMKLRNYYEKPSERRVREKAEAVRRARKLARKRAQREGLIPGKPAKPTGPGASGGFGGGAGGSGGSSTGGQGR